MCARQSAHCAAAATRRLLDDGLYQRSGSDSAARLDPSLTSPSAPSARAQYLGLYDSEDLAAVAYDEEAVRQRGLDAVTNFNINEYAEILAEYHSQAWVPSASAATLPLPVDHTAGGGMMAAAAASGGAADSSWFADTHDTYRAAGSSEEALSMAAAVRGRPQPTAGPAVAVEPSTAAVHAVQAFFALAPSLSFAARAQPTTNADMPADAGEEEVTPATKRGRRAGGAPTAVMAFAAAPEGAATSTAVGVVTDSAKQDAGQTDDTKQTEAAVTIPRLTRRSTL